MASPGSTSNKSTRKSSGASKSDAPDPATRLSRSLSDSAQQIWLAGVGALGRAQAEGSRLFETLAKEGQTLEQSARRFAGEQADGMRDTIESGVGTARDRATDTWSRLEGMFESGVHRALVALGVPDRDDIADLSRRVDTLTAELRRQGRKVSVGDPATRAQAARKTPGKHAVGPAAKVTKKKVATKAVAKKTPPRTPPRAKSTAGR